LAVHAPSLATYSRLPTFSTTMFNIVASSVLCRYGQKKAAGGWTLAILLPPSCLRTRRALFAELLGNRRERDNTLTAVLGNHLDALLLLLSVAAQEAFERRPTVLRRKRLAQILGTDAHMGRKRRQAVSVNATTLIAVNPDAVSRRIPRFAIDVAIGVTIDGRAPNDRARAALGIRHRPHSTDDFSDPGFETAKQLVCRADLIVQGLELTVESFGCQLCSWISLQDSNGGNHRDTLLRQGLALLRQVTHAPVDVGADRFHQRLLLWILQLGRLLSLRLGLLGLLGLRLSRLLRLLRLVRLLSRALSLLLGLLGLLGLLLGRLWSLGLLLGLLLSLRLSLSLLCSLLLSLLGFCNDLSHRGTTSVPRAACVGCQVALGLRALGGCDMQGLAPAWFCCRGPYWPSAARPRARKPSVAWRARAR
jgi:hypothetical protein